MAGDQCRFLPYRAGTRSWTCRFLRGKSFSSTTRTHALCPPSVSPHATGVLPLCSSRLLTTSRCVTANTPTAASARQPNPFGTPPTHRPYCFPHLTEKQPRARCCLSSLLFLVLRRFNFLPILALCPPLLPGGRDITALPAGPPRRHGPLWSCMAFLPCDGPIRPRQALAYVRLTCAGQPHGQQSGRAAIESRPDYLPAHNRRWPWEASSHSATRSFCVSSRFFPDARELLREAQFPVVTYFGMHRVALASPGAPAPRFSLLSLSWTLVMDMARPQ